MFRVSLDIEGKTRTSEKAAGHTVVTEVSGLRVSRALISKLCWVNLSLPFEPLCSLFLSSHVRQLKDLCSNGDLPTMWDS